MIERIKTNKVLSRIYVGVLMSAGFYSMLVIQIAVHSISLYMMNDILYSQGLTVFSLMTVLLMYARNNLIAWISLAILFQPIMYFREVLLNRAQ
jgi:membrane glycosyltransferase